MVPHDAAALDVRIDLQRRYVLAVERAGPSAALLAASSLLDDLVRARAVPPRGGGRPGGRGLRTGTVATATFGA